jgi:hypothetical protein
MANKSLQLWAAVLLMVGGLVHLIPALYTALADLTGGQPWIQIIVGILSVIVALVMFAGEKQKTGESASSSTPGAPGTPGPGGGM